MPLTRVIETKIPCPSCGRPVKYGIFAFHRAVDLYPDWSLHVICDRCGLIEDRETQKQARAHWADLRTGELAAEMERRLGDLAFLEERISP
jgi:hypothetical protein